MTVKSWKRICAVSVIVGVPTVIGLAYEILTPGDKPRTLLAALLVVTGGAVSFVIPHTLHRIVEGWVRCVACGVPLTREREYETKKHSVGRCTKCGSLYRLEKKT